MSRIEFHPEALLELEAAQAWYRERDLLLARAFGAEIVRAISTISDHPDRFPRNRGNEHRLVLQQFPFSIIYRIRDNDVFVTAVAHQRRRPNYWRSRK
jgi:plasmid stabilization system protein ParE